MYKTETIVLKIIFKNPLNHNLPVSNIKNSILQIVFVCGLVLAQAQFRPRPGAAQANYGGGSSGGKVIGIVRQSQDVNFDGTYNWR